MGSQVNLSYRETVLETQLTHYLRRGYEVVGRTSVYAVVARPRQVSKLGVVVLAVIMLFECLSVSVLGHAAAALMVATGLLGAAFLFLDWLLDGGDRVDVYVNEDGSVTYNGREG